MVVLMVGLTVLALVVVGMFGKRPSSAKRKRRVCPQSIFDVTSLDLWPCSAVKTLSNLNMRPCCVSRQVPAVFPWDAQYNTLRLNVNLNQQRLPLFVVRAKCSRDVVNTIKLAQKHKQLISVRSGGHCNEPFSIYNAIVLVLGSFSGVHLNENTGVLTCNGGATQGQVFKALASARRSFGFALAHRHHSHSISDLAINTGTVVDVGISGIVSAGGVGFLQRMLGLTIDSVVLLKVALANGTLVTATAENDRSDLFVALRGSGGGNYGVITQIQFQLHEIGELIVFNISWTDWNQASLILQTWQSLAPFYPNSLTQQLYFVVADGAAIPTVSSSGVFVGTDQAQLSALLQPFLAIPSATVSYFASTFVEQAKTFASGRTYFPFSYRRTQFVFSPLSNLAISTLISQVESAVGIPGVHAIEFDPFGGRVAEIDQTKSAFYARAAQFWLLFATLWTDQSNLSQNLAWSKTIFYTMQPFTSQFCYTGFTILDLPDYPQSYYGTLLPTLQTTKNKYDPLNFFQFPQNIPAQ